jgi:hypothetical protein
MNFDEELRRAFDTLGDRLRDDISRELHLLVDEVAASAKADREAAASLAAQSATEEAEAAARAQAAQAATAATEAAETTRARAAIDAAEAVKAAVEAVRAEHAAAERTAPAVASAPAETGAPAVDEDDAGERLETIIGTIRAIDQARSLSEVLDALVAGAGQEAARAAVLLVRGGRVRGFRFTGFAPTFDGSSLDVGLSDAGIISIAVGQNRPASSASDGAAPAFADLAEHADSTEAIAIPVAVAGEVVAVLYVDQPDPEPGVLMLEPAALEVLARHAARALEALTALKTARSIVTDGAASAAAGTHGAHNGASRGPAAEDEDEAARRYARLVISEIKLYHEDAVAEGRRDRNLATRLGGEIARARAMYEQRVPAHLRGAHEHFHAELVRTLAGGDVTLFAKARLS